MATIGETLREAREQLGLTLEEAERATRIRTHHLQALENEAWDSLPSPVQARGFLHNYADFLGLDPNAVLLLYVDVLQQRRAAPAPAAHAATTGPNTEVAVRRPRRISSDLVIASLVVLAVMVVLGWGVQRVAAGFRERTLADAAGASPTAAVEPTVVPTEPLPDVLAQGPAPLLLEATPTLAPPPILAAGGRVNVQLVIERRAWVRVLVDGAEQYAGRAAAGEVLEFQGQSAIEVVTGNGGGVRAFYQGEDTGLMGGFDEAVLRIWSVAGPITPTPTATPAVTATPTPSATATAVPGG
jgi:transcriptional regulator with XRE-family HTH domain